MERPIFKPVGTPVEQLDTPALVVDLAILERNIDTLHGFFRQHDAKVRPLSSRIAAQRLPTNSLRWRDRRWHLCWHRWAGRGVHRTWVH